MADPTPFQPSSSLLGEAPQDPLAEALAAAWWALELWRVAEARALLASLEGVDPEGHMGTALLLVRALLARREGRSAPARALFEQAWSQTDGPGHLRSLVGLESAHHLHRLGEVEAAGQRLRDSDPGQGALRPRWLLAGAQLHLQQGRPEQARGQLDDALAGARAQDDTLSCAAAHLALASLECAQGRFPAGEEHARRARSLARDLGDLQREGAASHALAQLAAQQGDDERSNKEARAAKARFEEVGDQRGRAASLRMLAELEARAGRPDRAQDQLTEAIGLLEALGDRRGRAATLHEQAILCYQNGLRGRARVLLDEVLREARQLGDRQAEAASLHLLAQIELREGANEQARTLLTTSIQVLEALGNRQDQAGSLVMLGQLDARQGRLEEGIGRLEEAVAMLRELGSGMLGPAEEALQQLQQARDRGSTEPFLRLLNQAAGALERGQLQLAQDAAGRALALSVTSKRADVEAIAHFQLAQVHLAQGRSREAVPHLAAADVLLGRQGRVQQQAVVRVLLERSRKG